MDMKTLGERAVASKHWQWMAGMLYASPDWRVWARVPDQPQDEFDEWVKVWLGVGSIPDFSDPATLGCLLALVREAWQGQFTVCNEEQLKAESLVKALEAAPLNNP